MLVKNPNAEQQGQVYFHDIGDYLSREEKLAKISELKSIQGIKNIQGWTVINPDEHGDWLNQRDDSFNNFIIIGDKKSAGSKIFDNFSLGVVTNRDAWCYQYSKKELVNNISSLINSYNSEKLRLKNDILSNNSELFNLIDTNPQKISWTRALKNDLKRNKDLSFDKVSLRKASYRPFTKINMYFNRRLNEMVYQIPQIFPSESSENFVISMTGVGTPKEFTCFILNTIPDLQFHANGQCFPLYLYDEVKEDKSVGTGDLFGNSLDLTVSETKYQRKDGISDAGLQHFQTAYPNEPISKEDIFYYTYGLLHSEEYRTRYADNLTKELPRIPCVKKAEDFWAFSKAGRELAHWHLNYETVAPYKATLDTGTKAYKELLAEDFYVEKMKFAKKGEKGTVIYNKRVTIKDIPLEAYEYVVNGKPALEWVMERQGVSTHKDSGIVNDANDWAIETMGNPAYPLELFLRVITVSLETMKIVKSLPKLDI